MLSIEAKESLLEGSNLLRIFTEYADGKPITRNDACAIVLDAFSFWNHISRKMVMPTVWKAASEGVVNQYLYHMETRHFELRLCADHWKADEAATMFYPLWYEAHLTKLNGGKC